MLDLAIEAKVNIDAATSIALGSMMSTTGANLSVGPPYDGCVYLNGSFDGQLDGPLGSDDHCRGNGISYNNT